MLHSKLSFEEIVQRGEELYKKMLRKRVQTADNIGKIIVIDADSGNYEIDDTSLPAADRLRARRPNAELYAIRIGYDGVYALEEH